MTRSSASSSGVAAVIGGSLSGLFAALLLKKHGWEVNIYEQSAKELTGRGAGILTHGGLDATLTELGLETSEKFGVELSGRKVYARDGSVVAALDFPQAATSWDRLFDLVRRALPTECYHLGKMLTKLDAEGERASLFFADGSSTQADLVVGADGIRSAVRHALLPDIEPVYAGYVAWRGLVEESEFSPAQREEFFGSLTFCLPPGEQMVGYLVAGRDNNLAPGPRRFNFVWYRPAAQDTELKRLLTDETGRTHELSIPPPLVRKDAVAEMRSAGERLLPPLFVDAIRRTPMPFLQPIYDLAVFRMEFGRVVLIGDAAFVARPHVGAGVSKAAEDALTLARCLAQENDVPAALRRFQAERLSVGRRIIDRARHLGAYLQAQRSTPAERAAAERHRSPEAVLAETASLAFLDDVNQGAEAQSRP